MSKIRNCTKSILHSCFIERKKGVLFVEKNYYNDFIIVLFGTIDFKL
jgi:hypothetical protein